MNEIVRTYLVGLELYLPPQESLALIRKLTGLRKDMPFFIQPFTGHA